MGFTTARRTWDVERNGRTYHVEMEDEYFFGRRVVRVNGKLAYFGRTVLSDHSGTYQFDLGGEPAFLKITTNGVRYYYDLVTQPPPSAATPDWRELAREPPGLTPIVLPVVLVLAIGAGMVLLTDGRMLRGPAVAVAGVPVDAAVTRAVTTTSGAHRIDYRFQVGARSFSRAVLTSEERYARARALGVIPVRYLAVAPEVNAIAPDLGDVVVDAALALGVIAFTGWTLVLAAGDLHDYRVWKRLSATGVDAVGRVTRVGTVRTHFRLVTGCVVEYAYSASALGEFRGHSAAFPLDAAVYFPVGTPVRIRYDPNRPGDSILLVPSA